MALIGLAFEHLFLKQDSEEKNRRFGSLDLWIVKWDIIETYSGSREYFNAYGRDILRANCLYKNDKPIILTSITAPLTIT